MATLKIISDKNCRLFIDQDFICEIEAQKLYKHELQEGVYLIDAVSSSEDDNNTVSFDLNIETANQQFLKRINFEDNIPSGGKTSSSFFNNPDVIFYNGVAKVFENGKYGYIDQSYKWIIEPQFIEAEHMKNGFAMVAKAFDQGKKYSFINPKGELCIGMWFDEMVNRAEETAIIRRYNELFKIDTKSMSIIDSWNLESPLANDRPIAVSKEINGKKIYKFIDLSFDVIIDSEYDYASSFSDSGYAEVEKYGIRRFINKKGDICILNSLKEIEAKSKLFMLLPTHNNYGEDYEWCGLLEQSKGNDLFLKNMIRLPIRKGGKWGYAYLQSESSNRNYIKILFEPRYDKFLSDSNNGYVIAKEGNSLCVVNIIGAQYARGDKKGQYVYGKPGDVLFKYECDEMYPINETSSEWMDYGGYGGNEIKRTFHNIIIKANGKYGIINRNSTFIQKCIYDNIYTQNWNESQEKVFEDSPFIVERDGKKGLITFDCKIALSCQFSEIYGIGRFWCIKRSDSDKYVLYDLSSNHFFDFEFDDIIYGNYQVHVRYDSCGTSGYDDYIIQNNSKYGVCSGKGEIIVDCIYDSIKHIHDRYEVCSKSKKGIISNEGNLIIPCNYDNIEEDWDACGGIGGYIVYRNQKAGFYTYDGKLIIDCEYDSIRNIESFDSYCYELVRNEKSAMFYRDKIVTDFIFESIGKELYSAYTVDEIDHYSFHDVIINGQHGIINEKGDFILNCEYGSIIFLSQCLPGMQPLFEVEVNGLKGIVTTGGNIIVPAEYEAITVLSYYCNSIDSYVVEKEGKKAILQNDWDEIGDFITDFEYTKIRGCYSSKHNILGYHVYKGEGSGFIGEYGDELLPCNFEDVEAIEDPNNPDYILLYIVKQNRKKGALDINGQVIVPCNYDNCIFYNTEKNNYICYNDNIMVDSQISYFGTLCHAININSKEILQLESKRVWDAKKELSELDNK